MAFDFYEFPVEIDSSLPYTITLHSFLAASGLLKKRSASSPAAPASSQTQADQSDVVQGNGPIVGTGHSPSSPAPAPSSPLAASVPPTSLLSPVPLTSEDKAGDTQQQQEPDTAAQSDLTAAQKIELAR